MRDSKLLILVHFLSIFSITLTYVVSYRVYCSNVGWWCGVVVSVVSRMNEVDPRWARLIPGWVTVFGQQLDM